MATPVPARTQMEIAGVITADLSPALIAALGINLVERVYSPARKTQAGGNRSQLTEPQKRVSGAGTAGKTALTGATCAVNSAQSPSRYVGHSLWSLHSRSGFAVNI